MGCVLILAWYTTNTGTRQKTASLAQCFGEVKKSDKQQILVKQLWVQIKQRLNILISELQRSRLAEFWLWLTFRTVFHIYCATFNSCELAKDLVLWFVAFLCCRSQAWAVREDGCCESSDHVRQCLPCQILLRSPTNRTPSVHLGLLCSEQETTSWGKQMLKSHLIRTWSVDIPEFLPSQSREPVAFTCPTDRIAF